MKKRITLFTVLVALLACSVINAQLVEEKWGFGFGITYPRLTSTNVVASNTNFGGFLSIQKNFSEHAAIRVHGSYIHLEGDYAGKTQTVKTNALTGSIDLLYYFVPCEKISPFISAGYGGAYYTPDNPRDKALDEGQLDMSLNFGLGFEYTFDPDWALKAELGHHTISGSGFDGAYGTVGGGMLGTFSDSYVTFDIGVVYFFDKGKESKLCQLYTGIKTDYDPVDYDKIENIVKKYIPKEVVKEVVVEKPVKGHDQKWVLVGVNFDFNSAKLKSESYPVLFHAVQVLLQNPDMKVEIQGHTDNIGSAEGNMKISQKRAETVKKYLVARGVKADRLMVKGYGETQPIADNKTADGRAANRRIEFKVLN